MINGILMPYIKVRQSTKIKKIVLFSDMHFTAWCASVSLTAFSICDPTI